MVGPLWLALPSLSLKVYNRSALTSHTGPFLATGLSIPGMTKKKDKTGGDGRFFTTTKKGEVRFLARGCPASRTFVYFVCAQPYRPSRDGIRGLDLPDLSHTTPGDDTFYNS
jgi:hypothetical protein